MYYSTYKTLRTCNNVETPSVKNQTLEGVLKQIMCSYYTTGVIDGTWAEIFRLPLRDPFKVFRPPFYLKFEITPKPVKTPENIEFQ